MKNTIVIFGAPDHEEKLAREIAEAAGCRVATACVATDNGQREPVHAGNAYRADRYQYDNLKGGTRPTKAIVFECSHEVASGFEEVIICDHHRPGDPGYEKKSNKFWSGSSLGQLCNLLEITAYEAGELAGKDKEDILMTAAGDHCPADAYAGKCGEIDPEDFWDFRVQQKADFEIKETGAEYTWEVFDVTVEKITKNIMAAEAKLEAAPLVNGIVDLREHGLLPELPEAAMKSGKKYMAKIDETDRAGEPTGNKKIVLGGCCTPEDVTNFMEWAGQLGNKMGEPYGVPARGFAGVVVTEPYCPTCKGEYQEEGCTCPSCGSEWPEFG
jgi:hypothetical protein